LSVCLCLSLSQFLLPVQFLSILRSFHLSLSLIYLILHRFCFIFFYFVLFLLSYSGCCYYSSFIFTWFSFSYSSI
jgi:hypothetical protein